MILLTSIFEMQSAATEHRTTKLRNAGIEISMKRETTGTGCFRPTLSRPRKAALIYLMDLLIRQVKCFVCCYIAIMGL